MYSRIKLFGHPVHPMLVAYPIALYTSTVVAYLAYLIGGDTFWFKIAVVANIAGVIMAAVTALPGFIDWATGIPSASPAKAHGLIHLLLNVGALVLFLINAIWHTGQFLAPAPDRVGGFILSLIGVGLTVGAGFLGWTMIQRDHVGVDPLPSTRYRERERVERPDMEAPERGVPA